MSDGMDMPMSRRQFLKRTLMFATAMALSGCSGIGGIEGEDMNRPNRSVTEEPGSRSADVIVIGAGIAGLYGKDYWVNEINKLTSGSVYPPEAEAAPDIDGRIIFFAPIFHFHPSEAIE